MSLESVGGREGGEVLRGMEMEKELQMMELQEQDLLLDSPAISARQDEYISKLRKANEALRHQLRAYSKALELSLENSNSLAAGSGLRALKSKLDHDGKKSLRAMVATKEKSLAALRKKVELYKKSITHLKKQLRKAYTSERVIQIGNENKEKEKKIQQLLEEKRNLVNIHRAQARQIQKADLGKEEWPERVASLQEELRLARDRYRELKVKIKESESLQTRQHEQMVRLTEKNKDLLRELKEHEAAHGVVREKPANPGEVKKAWEKERRGYMSRIQQLEKANRRDKAKLDSATKRSNQVIQELKLRIEGYKEKVEEREREMRSQLLQVKKLKRNLRELAMGDLPELQVAWNKDLEDYFTGEKEIGSPESTQGPNRPTESPKELNPLRESRIKDIAHEDQTNSIDSTLSTSQHEDIRSEAKDLPTPEVKTSIHVDEEQGTRVETGLLSGDTHTETEKLEEDPVTAAHEEPTSAPTVAEPIAKENTFAKPTMRRKRKGKAF